MAKESGFSNNTNNQKGRILEEVVAKLHEYEGVTVEKNARLPAIKNPKRKPREIDVLLTKRVLGEKIHTIIQCKNESGKLGIERIDEFIGFLQDVGIPSQQGILICVNGYTKDALLRAKEVGIKTLVLKGLTSDRLAKAVEDSFQYLVFLVPEVTEISITNKISPKDSPNALVFVYRNKEYAGYLLDLIVNQWRQGKTPNDFGEYEFNLKIPQGWYQVVNNVPRRTNFITIKARIVAHVIEVKGKLEKFSVFDTQSETMEKFHLNAEFAEFNEKRFTITKVFSESQLNEIINHDSTVRIINKIRLPRVIYNNIYHPISKRILDFLKAQSVGLSKSAIRNRASLIDFEGMEGDDLISSAFENPFFPFPVLVEDNEGNVIDIRLLMKNNRYREVLDFKKQFEANPTPEFAALLEKANKEVGKQILGK